MIDNEWPLPGLEKGSDRSRRGDLIRKMTHFLFLKYQYLMIFCTTGAANIEERQFFTK